MRGRPRAVGRAREPSGRVSRAEAQRQFRQQSSARRFSALDQMLRKRNGQTVLQTLREYHPAGILLKQRAIDEKQFLAAMAYLTESLIGSDIEALRGDLQLAEVSTLTTAQTAHLDLFDYFFWLRRSSALIGQIARELSERRRKRF